jgi:hypothetical protein
LRAILVEDISKVAARRGVQPYKIEEIIIAAIIHGFSPEANHPKSHL